MKHSSSSNKLNAAAKTKTPLFSFILPVAAFFCFLLLTYQLSQSHRPFIQSYLTRFYTPQYDQPKAAPARASDADPCRGRYVYVYDLPHRFNSDIINDCGNLSRWSDMCKYVANRGLGPRIIDNGSVLPETGWHKTDQFMLEYIFHGRMKQYECLTANYSKSATVYIPYYVGMDVMRYLWGYNVSTRDALTKEFVTWLRARPEWAARKGKDHFMVVGRIAWDFQRPTEAGQGWGGTFLTVPEVKNMTLLLIETSNWRENEFGIPYPTYFHPSNLNEVSAWQEYIRTVKRPWLFSFAGARRPNKIPTMRDLIIDQCLNATLCNLQECGSGAKSCYSPGNIMGVFMSSNFCLQPPGDSYTRKSAFDSMVAGCIPVFLHPSSAYSQYKWYLPTNFNKFSVYVPEKAVREGTVRIEDVLLGYSEEQIQDMREQIVEMVPRLVYKDPRIRSDGIRDAFDVAVDGVLGRIRSMSSIHI